MYIRVYVYCCLCEVPTGNVKGVAAFQFHLWQKWLNYSSFSHRSAAHYINLNYMCVLSNMKLHTYASLIFWATFVVLRVLLTRWHVIVLKNCVSCNVHNVSLWLFHCGLNVNSCTFLTASRNIAKRSIIVN